MEKRIIEACFDIVRDKIDRHALLLNEHLAATNFETMNRNREQLVEGTTGFFLRDRLVGAPVGVVKDVHDGMNKHQRAKSHPQTEHGRKIYDCGHAIHLNQGPLGRSFATMNREAADLQLEVQRNHVKAAEFYAASGGMLKGGHETPPHHLLERVGRDVPEK